MVVIKQAVQMLLQKFVSEDTDIIKLRDDKENSLQKEVKNKYLNQTIVKDELFGLFSKLVKEDPQFENKNHRKAVIENWAIWMKTKNMSEERQKDIQRKILQQHCSGQGYTIQKAESESDSFFSAVHNQVKNIPRYKDWTLHNLKECVVNGLQNNGYLFQMNLKTEEDKIEFIRQGGAEFIKNNQHNISLKILTNELNCNGVIMQPLKPTEILKVNNKPEGTIILAKLEDTKYYSCVPEKLGNNDLHKQILHKSINLEMIKQYKRTEDIEDMKIHAKALLKLIEKQIVKQSQIDRDHDLEKCKEQWKEFQAK